MTTDNKVDKDKSIKPKKKEYTTYKWQEEQLIKSVASVVHSAKFPSRFFIQYFFVKK